MLNIMIRMTDTKKDSLKIMFLRFKILAIKNNKHRECDRESCPIENLST